MHISLGWAARLTAAFMLFAASSFAFAAASQPFDAKAFKAAQAAGIAWLSPRFALSPAAASVLVALGFAILRHGKAR